MRRIFLITILLVVPLLLTGCGWRPLAESDPSTSLKTTKEPTSQVSGAAVAVGSVNYLTVDPATLSADMVSNQELAEQKVKDWQKEAVLYHFSAKLPANLAVGQATEVYTYGSANDAYNWWTLNSSGKTEKTVRAIIPKEDYLGSSLQPIPTQFWKINYVEAFQLAETNGGADYRSSHPDAQITINLSVGEPKDYLWWVVEYRSSGIDPFRILVNPSTKEVYNQSGIPITAASPVAP